MNNKDIHLRQHLNLKQELLQRPDLQVKQIITAELLQLPILELETKLTNEIMHNPALEIVLDDDEAEEDIENREDIEIEDKEEIKELYEKSDEDIVDELKDYISNDDFGVSYKDFTEIVEDMPILKGSTNLKEHLVEQYHIYYSDKNTEIAETIIYSLDEHGLLSVYMEDMVFHFLNSFIKSVIDNLMMNYDIEIRWHECCISERIGDRKSGKRILSIEQLPLMRRRIIKDIFLPDERIFIDIKIHNIDIWLNKKIYNYIKNWFSFYGIDIKKMDFKLWNDVKYGIITINPKDIYSFWKKKEDPLFIESGYAFREDMTIKSFVKDIFIEESLKYLREQMRGIEIKSFSDFVADNNIIYYGNYNKLDGTPFIRFYFTHTDYSLISFIKSLGGQEKDKDWDYYHIDVPNAFLNEIIPYDMENDKEKIYAMEEQIKKAGKLLMPINEFEIPETNIFYQMYKYSIRFYLNSKQYDYVRLIDSKGETPKFICGKTTVICYDKYNFMEAFIPDEEMIILKEKIKSTIKNIQTLEPDGIAQYSYKDAILYQLNKIKQDPPKELEGDSCFDELNNIKNIIDNYYYEILESFKKNQKMETIKDDEYDCIKKLFANYLNPYPTSGKWADESALPVIPDVSLKFVETYDYDEEKRKIDIIPILNKISTNSVRLNRDYLIYYRLLIGEEHELVKEYGKDFIKQKKRELENKWLRGKKRSSDIAFLKKSVERGINFKKSFYEREHILKRLIKEIIERQKDFILNPKEENLKPLSRKEIAEKLNINESMVSRAVSNKYIDTPHGIFPMSKFFSRSLTNESGEKISRISVKEFIKNLIGKEDKTKPYADEEIVKIVSKDMNIEIKRRTVAKYREEMGIPSSRKRRQK